MSSNNALPPAILVTDATVLSSTGMGTGASNDAEAIVTLNVSTMTSHTPCPLPFTTSTGMMFCDGFNALDSAQHAVVVDTFNYLGSNPPCKSTLPTSGAAQSLATITGVWEGSYNTTSRVTTWALMLTSCSGIGQGTAPAGTATPPASAEVHALLTAFPTSSTSVTLKGVVVATRPASSTGAFGFVIEDPAGGPASGIKVLRSKTSTSTAAPPAIGDLVTVTGTSRGTATTFQQIDL